MVNQPLSDQSDYYEELQERWPAERPSRKRARRASTRAERRVVVHSERLKEPDVERMSRALLATQSAFARLQAEADAKRKGTASGSDLEEAQP